MNSGTDKHDFEDEIVDIERYTDEGRRVPDRCKGYQISVNGRKYTVKKTLVTREEVADLVNVGPVKEVCVRVRIRGERPRVLQPGEEVDLTAPGIERFLVEEKCIVGVEVNNTSLQLAVPTTGEGVKQAAIKAGVSIELDFVLFLELDDGQAEQIDDSEVIFVDDGASFSAVSGDDNS